MSCIDELNDEQKTPATLVEGPILVTAGAGSGKTRLLTHRIAYLVDEMGVSPKNILAITFTNKATNEMKERITRLVNHNVEDMWICTFHSMCSKLLRAHAARVGLARNFSIYGDTEKERLVKRLLKDNSAYNSLEKNALKFESVCYHISNAKNELLSPNEYAKRISHERYADIIINTYINYQREMLLCNAVDFDDLLVKAYELLSENDDIRDYYQSKFEFIHVDEFQDTNVVQYELVRILGEKYNNIFAVGDEDQCIYSWRGARFTNVAKFIDDNKGINIFKLEQNFRSTSNILKAANNIIKNNINRIDKNLWTSKEGGEEVKLITAYSDHEEAEFVASKIKQMVSGGTYKYSNFAVLMRVNSLSRVIEEKFLNYNIPYKVYGGFKFFERKEVKDSLSYLKIISNPKDNDSFLRILAFPKKGIGESTVRKILTVADETNLSLFELASSGVGLDESTLKKLEPTMSLLKFFISQKDSTSMYDLFCKIIDEFGLKNSFSKEIEEELSKIYNIETLAKSIKEFEEINTNSNIDDYLQSVTLSRDIDSLDESEDNVSLMTIHSAKGLEFKVVFVVGLVEGVLPLSRSVYSLDPNELEEERRLMYVASTRAKEQLFYTRPTSKFSFESGKTESATLSRFVKESGVVTTAGVTNKYGSYERDGYGNKYKYSTIINEPSDNGEGEPVKPVSSAVLSEYKKYKVGTIVMHKNFGKGVVTIEVTDMVGAFVTIKFESVGIKTLSLKFAPLTIIGGE